MSTSKRCLTKGFTWLLVGVIAALLLVVFIIFPNLALSVHEHSINQSLFFTGLRWVVYAVIYFRWQSIAQWISPSASQDKIDASRRPLVTLIAVYEVFLGFNIFAVFF